MSHTSRFAALALSLLLFPVAAQSGSLSASSHALSRAISATVRAASHSLRASSRASEKAVALNEGDYRVVEVADAPPEANTRLTLMPLASEDPEDGVYLFLPAGQTAGADLRQGAIVSVNSRPYGIAISLRGAAHPFALVLEDSWTSRLDPTAVTL
ncbi:hypothetical protein [Niveibacterium terrae]|uniref:hypothetical protein n=1 Tax=Niveibacterium terrae TaxID=3373598 RepID=UPI003A9547D7